MKITKYGHCCLLIEEGDLRILTDPGGYSTRQSGARNLGVVLITHEHSDHLHVESLKEVLKNNTGVRVVTNKGVGKILDKEGVVFQLLEHGGSATFKGVLIEGFGEKHAEIYKGVVEPVDNTGYFIGDKLFYPGDALTNPGKRVDVLALPVAGPWIKVSEAIDYGREIMPRACFPVHDGAFQKGRGGAAHSLSSKVLTDLGVTFVTMEEGIEYNF